VEAVVIAAPPGHQRELERLAGALAGTPGEPGAFHPIVVTGGATRSASVGLALAEAPSGAELCLVHDAARPLITPTLIEALVDRLSSQPEAAGVIAATPLIDTVKRATGEAIAETADRSELWSAQTPQAFRTEILREAHSADHEFVAAATDDAMLVERLGGRVLIEPAPPENLKVTTHADLLLADLLLRERNAAA
jgi:2-C-methyl-D-erythritol 4-phosphate cytidylyltransferase